MLEMHLWHPRFYMQCLRTIYKKKNKKRIQKFNETGDSQHNHQNELQSWTKYSTQSKESSNIGKDFKNLLSNFACSLTAIVVF